MQLQIDLALNNAEWREKFNRKEEELIEQEAKNESLYEALNRAVHCAIEDLLKEMFN